MSNTYRYLLLQVIKQTFVINYRYLIAKQIDKLVINFNIEK